MDFEQLKQQVKEIGEVAEAAPEPFREKCFELLFNALLTQSSIPSGRPAQEAEGQGADGNGNGDKGRESAGSIPMTSALRLFIRKTEITQDELERLLMFDQGEVHFIREPEGLTLARGQIEWALLLALKNAIENDRMAADPEAVRSMCQDKGYYDPTNFSKTFKKPNNKKFFKQALVAQGDPEPLTPDGLDELAGVIRRLVGNA